jgi:hypothetical protein
VNTSSDNNIGAALPTPPPPLREAGQIRPAKKENLRIFFIRCVLPISVVRIAAPVLVEHKEHERIGEAQKGRASPIFTDTFST